MATSFERAIEQMIWKITVVEPLLRSLQSLINGAGGLDFLGLGGSGVTSTGAIAGAIGPTSVGGPPLVGSANGNVFSMAQASPLRMVTGDPPVRGGGGMPQRIITSSRSAPALRMTGAGKSGKTPGIGGKLPTE
jgi:hypothetical protein